MASRIVGRFIEALQQAEQQNDPEPLVGVFADDATFSSPRRETRGGADACRRFWKDYLAAFQEVRSSFKDVREGDGFAVLEWETRGKLIDGQPVSYTGVSLLHGDGERLHAFRTYFDMAPFERHR